MSLPLPLDVPSPRQNAQIEHAAEPARATLVSSEDNLIADDNRLPMRIKLCHKFTLHCLHFVRESYGSGGNSKVRKPFLDIMFLFLGLRGCNTEEIYIVI